MEKNCLFMHEGVIVTQTSDMLYFQGQFLIPEELQNCKLKKTCYSACVHKEILIFHGVTGIADTSKIKKLSLGLFRRYTSCNYCYICRGSADSWSLFA